jgi:signal transduction histidine kinase
MSFDRIRGVSTNTNEWCAEGVLPQTDFLAAVPLDSTPWFLAELVNGPVGISSLDELPLEAAAERELLAVQGIQSILVVPVRGAAGVLGFVGFDAVRVRRCWDRAEVELLTIFAMLAGAVLERRAASERLACNQRRLAAVVAALPDVLFTLRESGEVVFAKNSADGDLVAPAAQLTGQSVRDFIPSPLADDVLGAVRAAIATQEVARLEYPLTVHGEERWFEARFVAHAEHEVTAVVRNVTAQHEARRSVEAHRSRLQALAAQQFSSEHELRTRVAAEVHDGIAQELAMARLLVARAARGRAQDQDLERASSVLLDAVKHLNELVSEIQPPLLRELGLVPALNDLARGMAGRHGLSLEFRASRVARLSHADEAALFWSSRELLVNVVKHSAARRVCVEVASCPDATTVSVEDDGRGLPQDCRWGFGLASSAERLRLRGGELALAAQQTGTRAVVRLPREKA